jgi:hypothetical protein
LTGCGRGRIKNRPCKMRGSLKLFKKNAIITETYVKRSSVKIVIYREE